MNCKTRATLYDDCFFNMITEGSLQSARIVVPILLNLVAVKSVIDVGCGRGAWLRVFQENGVKRIKGLDGFYVEQSQLPIDPICFTSVDLTRPFDIKGRYDLAVCLEVAEHLPAKAGPGLVRSLTATAPLVLFSAAIPGQVATGHENERWPWYWKSLFSEQGFRRLDLIRGRVWQDKRVEWWYRQNMFLYASETAIAASRVLQEEAERSDGDELEVLHQNILAHYTSLRAILKEVPRVALRAVKHRLEWVAGVSTKSA